MWHGAQLGRKRAGTITHGLDGIADKRVQPESPAERVPTRRTLKLPLWRATDRLHEEAALVGIACGFNCHIGDSRLHRTRAPEVLATVLNPAT